MNGRERFLAACNQDTVDTTPVWIMRQAGRYLPEYRALKQKHCFTEMVQTPRLAKEVTLQPLKRFDLDAAILFSDILVIPEALGQPYRFKSEGGIEMAFTLNNQEDINRLNKRPIHNKLNYVAEALHLIKNTIRNEKALLGFGGSPWTLATYMIEGGAITNAAKTRSFLGTPFFDEILKILTDTLIEYFLMQIEAGVDAIQIFDSWAQLCPKNNYWEYSLKWVAKIIEALPDNFPIILYAKGVHDRFETLLKTKSKVYSLDWTANLKTIQHTHPGRYTLQGNLDPALMNGSQEPMLEAAHAILKNAQDLPGHIFNLGHGIQPQAKPENVEALVNYVHAFRKDSSDLLTAAR